MTEEIFYFGEVGITLPPRTTRIPSNHADAEYLELVQGDWRGFCNMAFDHISSRPQSDIMCPNSFTPKGLRRHFTLPKEEIRRNVLKDTSQSTIREAYRYFIIGSDVTGEKNNPKLRVSRLELFQLLGLTIAAKYHIQEMQRRNQEHGGLQKKPVAYARMMSQPPEGGGPLMNAK